MDWKADVNACNNTNHTPLHLGQEHPNVMRTLVGARADVNAQSMVGNAVLHGAVETPECVAVLLEARAVVDVLNIFGRTPLARAIAEDLCESAELLLGAGAKMDKVPVHMRRPAWLKMVLLKLGRCRQACVTFYGIMRKRFRIASYPFPRDIAVMVTSLVWSARSNDAWLASKASSTKKRK